MKKDKKQKGKKADSIEKTAVDQLFERLEHASFSIDDQPYASLFKIYYWKFLNQSVEKGLIDTSSISNAGNGTPVVTSARERKHRICDCSEKGINDCDCDR